MGDFNGKCTDKCPFTSKTILKKQCSYNGDRLLRFIDSCELSVLNTLECCNGSAIDYILMSNELIHKVDQVFIDEEGKYDLNSDHVIDH